MTKKRCWRLLACSVVLFGGVLGGVLVYGRFGTRRPGGSPMNDARFTVDHVRLATDKPFEDVAKAFERQLGRFEPARSGRRSSTSLATPCSPSR